jgi:hypothetical protein
VNSGRQNDGLDDALSARTAISAPPGFTGAVLARVNARPRRSRPTELLAEYGVRGGLWLAALGVLAVVDANPLGEKLTAALVGPEGATAVAVLAICLVWVLTQREPEGEAL